MSREIEIPDVDEIMHPTWAPDGHAICFTGMHQGVTDLFVYDLQVNRLRQLTRDAYADLQPSWSPDGRRIAFSTDRFSSNLTTLAFGPYMLASIDPESGAVQQISTTTEGKHINPQWAPDGRSIYFISDRDGIPNIYRTTVGESAETTQITHVTTGISGITNLSPAMSVASKAGTVAFSVYQDSKYDIRTTSAETQGTPLPPASVTAATLPPLARNASEVASLLAAPEIGLPEPATYEVEPYKTKLSLQGVSQPVVGVGVSRFGTSFGGGIALTFGDQLGNHLLATALQVNTGIAGSFSVKDIGAQVAYMNLSRRWNWGLVGGQIPYLSSGFQSAVRRLPNGDLVQSDQLFVFRQTERNISGVVSYPLDRARRLEFQGGVSNISFDQTVQTTTFSLNSGAVFEDTSETTPLAETLNLGTSSAALRGRLDGVRCYEPGAGAAVSIRSVAHVRDDQLHGSPRRLSPLLHAGAVLHLGCSADALRPIWQRLTGHSHFTALRRISLARARLRRQQHRLGRMHPDAGWQLRVDRSVAGQPDAGGQRRTALPAASSVRCYQQYVRSASGRGCALCRFRHRLESGRTAVVQRRIAQRSLLGGCGAAGESAGVCRRRIRFRTCVPETRPWLDLRVQPHARLVTGHDLCTPLPQSCDN